jgi:predicted alpha/beta hydrolase
LCDLGLAVLNFDVRGHGQSRPTANNGGTWTYDDIVQADIPAMIEAARRHYPKQSVAIVGHSLVAHAAMIHAGLKPKESAEAIVSFGGNLWMPDLEPSLWTRLLKGGCLIAWAAISFPLGRFDAPFFGMGSDAEPWPYVKQLVLMYLRNELKSLQGIDDYKQALGQVRIPVLSFASEGDRWFGHPEAVTHFLSLLKKAKVKNRIIKQHKGEPPIGHMELVTSQASKPYWIEAGKWILKTVGKMRNA